MARGIRGTAGEPCNLPFKGGRCDLAPNHSGPHYNYTTARKKSAGRPEVGTPINVRLGDELLAAVDAKANRLGVSRAELIRMLLADSLQGEMST
jgi:hypothetical protein